MGLKHYLAVVRQHRLPLWWRSRQVPALPNWKTLTTDQLWAHHDELVNLLHSRQRRTLRANALAQPSLLDVKRELVHRHYQACDLCPWRCGVNRLKGEKGVCGLGAEARVFREGLLVSEEPFVVPTHELFLTGCNMRCTFCQAWEGVVRTDSGIPFSPAFFKPLVQQRQREGACNVHFVGGEPSVNLLAVLNALRVLDIPLPLVWNTNLFITDETMRLLDGVVDLFLVDFKFGNNECAQRIGKVSGYVSTLQNLLPLASRSASMVVRHLVMPGHLDCCLEPVVRWVAENLPQVPFHLMLNYIPDWKAWDDPQLQRRLTGKEKRAAQQIVRSSGLRKVLVTSF